MKDSNRNTLCKHSKTNGQFMKWKGNVQLKAMCFQSEVMSV